MEVATRHCASQLQLTWHKVIQACLDDPHGSPCQASILRGAELFQLLPDKAQASWHRPIKKHLKLMLCLGTECLGQGLFQPEATR